MWLGGRGVQGAGWFQGRFLQLVDPKKRRTEINKVVGWDEIRWDGMAWDSMRWYGMVLVLVDEVYEEKTRQTLKQNLALEQKMRRKKRKGGRWIIRKKKGCWQHVYSSIAFPRGKGRSLYERRSEMPGRGEERGRGGGRKAVSRVVALARISLSFRCFPGW